MDKAEIVILLKQLANGIDPRDGKAIPTDRKTIIALSYAIGVLEHTPLKLQRSQPNRLPANAGNAWKNEEDLLLLAEFDNGMSIADIATKHQRTLASISQRLEKHGKLISPGPPPRRGPLDEHVQG